MLLISFDMPPDRDTYATLQTTRYSDSVLQSAVNFLPVNSHTQMKCNRSNGHLPGLHGLKFCLSKCLIFNIFMHQMQ